MENTRLAVLSGHIRPRNLTTQSCADEGGDRDQIFSGHVDGIVFEGDNLLKKFQSSGRGTRSELLSDPALSLRACVDPIPTVPTPSRARPSTNRGSPSRLVAGAREANALKTLSASSKWGRFVPKFGGLRTDTQGEQWMMMQNLTAGMGKPTGIPSSLPAPHSIGCSIRHEDWNETLQPRRTARESAEGAEEGVHHHHRDARAPNRRLQDSFRGLPHQ